MLIDTGWLTPQGRLDNLGTVSNITRLEAVGGWQNISLHEKMPDMFWQYGFSGYSYGRNHDDGFTIFLDEYVSSLVYDPADDCSAEAKDLVYKHARDVNRLNHRH